MTPPTTERDDERRQATVLFADISGFTAMSERMDPEDVTALVNACFAMLEEVVGAHGGHVDKYIGDCIMALFGVPNALEHAARQAVNAAIEMRRRLAAMNQEKHLPQPLGIHVGINSGLVVAGHVGGATKRDFTVMGDTVNLASRLKDAAPSDGAIWVGMQTWRDTRGDFEYRELPALTVKGKADPVLAYEVLSKHERVHRARPGRGERMIFSDLIGRDRELDTLAAALADLRGGTGGIMTLVGDPGLGKSRLVAELCGRASTEGILWLEGRSLAVGTNLAFHPFVDLLRQWAGIGDEAGDEAAAQKLEDAVRRVVGDDADETHPFVATLMGMRLGGRHAERVRGIEGEALEKLIAKAVRDLFHRLAATAPVVCVFEDVHWADQSSVKLLEGLFRLVREVPLLVLQVMRPDYAQTGQRLRRSATETHPGHHREIALERLSEQQADALVQSLLKVENLPWPVRASIVRKTEGNPFFIEEVLRSLIDEGVLVQQGEGFRVAGDVASVIIPGTIQEVIMARIDRLPEATRQLLQLISVVGRNAPQRIVADVVKGSVDLEWQLGYLKKRQLLSSRQTGDETEYVFKHALAQETIYESILQKTRKDLHRQVAHSIETQFADRLVEFYGMLAYHYSRAESLEKAEEYLFKAGDEAARSAASSEALDLFREASRVYLLLHGEGGDPLRKAKLEENIGLALLNTGALTESIQYFDRSLAHLGDRSAEKSRRVGLPFAGDFVACLAGLYRGKRSRRVVAPDDPERRILQVRYNRTKAQTTSDPQGLFFDYFGTIRRANALDPVSIADEACGLYSGFACLWAYSGLSFRMSERCLGIARGLVRGDDVKDNYVYRLMQFVHDYLRGNWDDAREIPDDLVERAARYGQVWDVHTYLGLNCERKVCRGDFAGAREYVQRFERLIETYGFDFATSNLTFMTAFLLLEEGHLDAAREAIDRYCSGRHEAALQVLGLSTRARIDVLAGAGTEAETTLAEVERILPRAGRLPPYHESAYRMSRALLDVTRLEAEAGTPAARRRRRSARRSVARATTVAGRIARERVEAFRLAGRLHWLGGRRRKALARFEEGLAEGERLGARPALARLHAEIAARLDTGGDLKVAGGDAAAHHARAAALADEIGLVTSERGARPPAVAAGGSSIAG
jgi:class 3 adenylate cyclase/tetratricopeptide (TPR) repeat protein